VIHDRFPPVCSAVSDALQAVFSKTSGSDAAGGELQAVIVFAFMISSKSSQEI
jgi:hypothetical protein